MDTNITKTLSDIEKRLDRQERLMRQPTRSHNIKQKEESLLDRDPSKIKTHEIKDRNLRLYKNGEAGGVVIRIGGRLFKIEGTLIE